MPVFGLTGDWGSGKTTILKELERKGAEIICLDEVIHRAYRRRNSPLYRRIKTQFPQVMKDNSISLPHLREVVFSSKQALKKLEEIVHPWIIKKLKVWIKKAKNGKIHIAEVPLLFEKRLESLFDAVIFVYVPRRILEARLKKITGFSYRAIRKRLSLFIPSRKKKRQSNIVVKNDGDLATLKKKISQLWKILLTFSSEKKVVI